MSTAEIEIIRWNKESLIASTRGLFQNLGERSAQEGFDLLPGLTYFIPPVIESLAYERLRQQQLDAPGLIIGFSCTPTSEKRIWDPHLIFKFPDATDYRRIGTVTLEVLDDVSDELGFDLTNQGENILVSYSTEIHTQSIQTIKIPLL